MQASGLDRNRSPLNYYTWVGVFFLVLALIIGALYVATIKIDYVWRWYRMPSYFFNLESVPIISDQAGKIQSIAKSGEDAQVVVQEDGGDAYTYDIPGGDVWVDEGDTIYAGDTLGALKEWRPGILAQGMWVISDRYLWSSLSYQSLSLDLSWVRNLNRLAQPPDLTLVLDLDPEAAARRLSREGRTQEIFDHLDLQRRIRAAYLDLARAEQGHPVEVVDGSGDVADVSRKLWQAVTRHLGNLFDP